MATNANRKKTKKAFRHYHFIGIGGMGMGNLALLMLAKGYVVSGSDLKENSITDKLKGLGARIHTGHHKTWPAVAELGLHALAYRLGHPIAGQSGVAVVQDPDRAVALAPRQGAVKTFEVLRAFDGHQRRCSCPGRAVGCAGRRARRR